MVFGKGEGMEEKDKAKTVGTISAMLQPARVLQRELGPTEAGCRLNEYTGGQQTQAQINTRFTG